MVTATKKHKWLTPLDIPAGKRGDAEIVREISPPGTKKMLGNIRTAMFGQKFQSSTVSYPFETTWHQLILDGVQMMSDWPIEQRQHDLALKGFRGRVLVGGLGLGYAATRLAAKKAVTEVVVVEINQNVVDLVAPYVKDPAGKIRVVRADLLKYLEQCGEDQYNMAFYDIWASDGEGTFFDTVCPLYDLSRGRVKQPPVNWNEDVMRGQLAGSLWSRRTFLRPEAEAVFGDKLSVFGKFKPWEHDGTNRPWHNWSVPYFQWWNEVKPTDKQADEGARLYAGIYGQWDWERKWQNARFMLSLVK